MSKYGYIDKSGRIVIPPQFDTPGYHTEGLASVEVDGKCRFIDKHGEFALPLQYEYVDDFSEGLAVFGVNGKYGYINRAGTVEILPTFKSADYFSDGLALVRTEAPDGSIHAHYIDTSGEKALTFPDDRVLYGFSEGLAPNAFWNEKEGTFDDGYIDTKGAEVFPTRFADASAFSEGYAYVKTKEGKRGFIDKTGQMVLELAFGTSSYSYYSEGLIDVKIDHKYGYADKTGSVVIEPRFDTAWEFSEGLAAVAVDAKYGYFEKSGEWVYDESFKGTGLYVDAKFGFIDRSGEWVIEPRFKEAGLFSEGLASVII